MRSQLMCLHSCIVQKHAEDANKMQEVDQKPLIQRMRQLGDTNFDDNTEEEGQTLALQVFGGAIPAPVEKDTEVADEAEESNGPPEGKFVKNLNFRVFLCPVNNICMELIIQNIVYYVPQKKRTCNIELYVGV